jgi:putative nucleotidyltransferase with HDIG domain
MRPFFRYILKNFSWIYRIILVLVSAVIIVILLPREGKFRYEYQKGQPWMHEMLVAPYNFPIYKSEAELEASRDSIVRKSEPYFVLDTTVFEKQRTSIASHFDLKWKQFIKAEYNLEYPEAFADNRLLKEKLVADHDRWLQFTSHLLESVYITGIVESRESFRVVKNREGLLVVMKGKMAQDRDTLSVFTQKKAYEYFVKQINAVIAQGEDKKYLGFMADLSLDELIQPNLFYNEATTRKVLDLAISDISMTRGMVQEGERIINRGDLVDNERFLMLESLRKEYEKRLGSYGRFMILVGQFLLVCASLLSIFLYMLYFRKEVLQNTLKSSFILFVVVLFFALTALVTKTGIASVYLIPITIVPIVIRTFYDARLSLFIHVVTILLIGFIVPNSFEYVFLSFLAGTVAIFSLSKIYRRGKLFMTAFYVLLTYTIGYFGMAIVQEGNIGNIQWSNYLWFGGNAILILLSYPLMYVFEKTFGFLSDARLVELMDTNQPLIRELTEKAPGTFQHSLQVANLAEEAALRTGGNPLLIRTGALYHDIGKMVNPVYFVENQPSGVNLHDNLSFEESAQIIVDHVKKGIEIARRHNLPPQIIDFIRTHHGTNMVHYFYRSYIKKHPENIVESSKFSYPGPKPFSREMAILMMADSVEAASRGIRNINSEMIDDLVEKIIDGQVADNQFTDADITFRQVHEIKAIFKRKLATFFHTRIEYPSR